MNRVITSDFGFHVLIKESAIDRLGAFAVDAIPAQTLFTEIVGQIYEESAFQQVYNDAQDRFLQIGEHLYLGPPKEIKEYGTIDEYLNHSCSPNCGITHVKDGYFFKALRNICPAEELTWDYSTWIDESDFSMPCKCQSAVCRGRVLAFRELGNEQKSSYIRAGVVMPYLCRPQEDT